MIISDMKSVVTLTSDEVTKIITDYLVNELSKTSEVISNVSFNFTKIGPGLGTISFSNVTADVRASEEELAAIEQVRK